MRYHADNTACILIVHFACVRTVYAMSCDDWITGEEKLDMRAKTVVATTAMPYPVKLPVIRHKAPGSASQTPRNAALLENELVSL